MVCLASCIGCGGHDPNVARDVRGPISESECLALLAAPNAWAGALADAVRLDETARGEPRQRIAAARYIAAARELLASTHARALEEGAEFVRQQAQLREELALLMLEEEVRDRVMDVDARAIEAYHAAHLEAFEEPEKRRFLHLFVDAGPLRGGAWRTRAQARRIAADAREAVERGAPLASLIAVASDSRGGGSGGWVGPVERGELRDEIDDAVWGSAPFEVSGVIETGSGMHVVCVMEEIERHVRPPHEVEEEIVSVLVAQRVRDEERKLRERVRQDRPLVYNPQYAKPSAPATATVLLLGETRVSRADCDRWFEDMGERERRLYRTPERRAAYIRERCMRMIRLAAAEVMGIAERSRYQTRLRQQEEALRIALLLEQRMDQWAHDRDEATVAMWVADVLNRNRFRVVTETP